MEEEKQKQNRDYFTDALAKMKDSPLRKGRYIKAIVNFHNNFVDDRVEETVCCIQKVNQESYHCYAFVPFVWFEWRVNYWIGSFEYW